VTTQKALLTAEELLKLPDNGQRQELLDGVLVEMPLRGWMHALVSGNVSYALYSWADSRHLGKVLIGVGVILRRNPDRVRAPDGCFIAQERLPLGGIPARYLDIVPDLIVEVVSPWDRPREIREKAEEWVRAGAQVVWVVHSDQRSVDVYRANSAVESRTKTDVLDAEPVLPGFAFAVGDLFA
jgi:Uma2 family endonuclease